MTGVSLQTSTYYVRLGVYSCTKTYDAYEEPLHPASRTRLNPTGQVDDCRPPPGATQDPRGSILWRSPSERCYPNSSKTRLTSKRYL